MSLFKIPFILLTTWGFNASLTPPNPPPPKHERIASRVPMENPIYIRWTVFIAMVSEYLENIQQKKSLNNFGTQNLQAFAATCEIATILASATPSWPISKIVLSLLVWSGGRPNNLHISNAAAAGFIVTILGAWIRLTAFRHLGRFFQFEASIQKDHELIVSGPYSVVRHPSYTGLILVFIAWFPWHMSKGSWIMESGLWDTSLVLDRMSKEDAALRNRFGAKWNDWAKRVPYSFVPGIY